MMGKFFGYLNLGLGIVSSIKALDTTSLVIGLFAIFAGAVLLANAK